MQNSMQDIIKEENIFVEYFPWIMDDAEEMLLGLLVLGAGLILLRRREK